MTGPQPRPATGTASKVDGGPPHAVRRVLVLVALALVLLVAGLWAVIALDGSVPGDTGNAAEVKEQHLHGLVLAPAHALDWLGRFPLTAVVIVALCAWAWRAFGWRHAVLAFSALGVSVLTWVIKTIADRTRPPGAGLTSPSFPSGHTTWTTAVFGLTAVFLLQRGHRLWAAACVVVIVAMGPARVLLGVHWTSDVLAGYAVGLAWLVVLVLFGLPWAVADGRPAESAERVHGR
ncbi:MAG: phosphatase PAP2 family protein [Solirubrobacteraceae bacterium]